MKTFKKLLKKYWKILLILLVVWFVLSVFGKPEQTETPLQTSEQKSVELFAINATTIDPLETICSVESIESPSIQAESSGQVRQVLVKENDTVTAGQTLFVLENVDQTIAVEEARVSVQTAQTQLDELISENTSEAENARLTVVTNQQDQTVAAARSAFLNNDLIAYPLDENDTDEQQGLAPTISGSYTCDTEGEYVIDVYASGGKTGASFHVLGLEKVSINQVSTAFPVALGSCGLQIQFPTEFNKNAEWSVQIPNTRSSSYIGLKNAYESAVNNRTVALEQTEASPEQITQARQQLSQAQLRLRSAQNRLAKTFIKAPVAGVVVETNLDTGDFVSTGQAVGSVRSVGQMQAVTFITEDEKRYVNEDTVATVGGIKGSIFNVGNILLNTAQKIKVEILLPKDAKLTEGDSVSCTLERTDNSNSVSRSPQTIIPLSSLAVIGTDTYVFVIDTDMNITRIPVTVGPLLGDTIAITDGLESVSKIILDARGVREGQEAVIEN